MPRRISWPPPWAGTCNRAAAASVCAVDQADSVSSSGQRAEGQRIAIDMTWRALSGAGNAAHRGFHLATGDFMGDAVAGAEISARTLSYDWRSRSLIASLLTNPCGSGRDHGCVTVEFASTSVRTGRLVLFARSASASVGGPTHLERGGDRDKTRVVGCAKSRET